MRTVSTVSFLKTPLQKATNQAMNGTFMHAVSAEWLRPTVTFAGCINARYRIRFA